MALYSYGGIECAGSEKHPETERRKRSTTAVRSEHVHTATRFTASPRRCRAELPSMRLYAVPAGPYPPYAGPAFGHNYVGQ